MFEILVVEDSEEYQKIVSRTLNGHHMTCVSSAEGALSLVRNSKYDLIILDINLPDKDGYSFITDVLENPECRNIPILCLSGRKEITDKVTAFSLGADDYITKPFDPIEFRARVESRLRKNQQKKTDNDYTTIGDIQIDHIRHRITVGEGQDKNEVNLTQTEFKLLCCLSRRPDQVFTRDQLLVAAWGSDARVLDRVVDAHICLLRKKIQSKTHEIKSVIGLGYKITQSRVIKK